MHARCCFETRSWAELNKRLLKFLGTKLENRRMAESGRGAVCDLALPETGEATANPPAKWEAPPPVAVRQEECAGFSRGQCCSRSPFTHQRTAPTVHFPLPAKNTHCPVSVAPCVTHRSTAGKIPHTGQSHIAMLRVSIILALLGVAAAKTYPWGEFSFKGVKKCSFLPETPTMAPPHPPRLADPCDHMKCPSAPGQCYEGMFIRPYPDSG